ncbi:substrate-binding domain-containing protein [Paraconexibacter antarcticus]|uniref:Substrate-binding domain-containing protein n=1 Tax=Paraconexibacter antarcticus TaxID=2949664 RepID=A0ABY5DKS4_9ACTN|nr:substrate-binding domain-containing protein [Paraconexibacter antarcticus]UTI62343.1 substrate-binding domain-containing protein [Paraconexibacter antarcticus]
MKKYMACIATVVAVGSVSACGSSNGSSTGSAPATAATTGSKAATGGFTGSTKLPSGKVGVLQVNAQSERIQIWGKTAKDALSKVGWKSEVIDGKGDPAAWAQAMTTFINEKVDGIVTLAIDPAAILPQLKAAKAAGIPVITAGITVAGPGKNLYAANYAPPDGRFGQVLADYLKTKFPAGTEYVDQDLTAVSGAHALITAGDPLMKAAGFKLVGTKDLNPADLVPQTSKAAVDLTAGHPKAKIMLTCCDFAPPIVVPALKQAGRTGVTIAARYDNPSSLALIRQGAPVVIAAADSDQSVLLAIGQLLAKKASGTAIDPKADAGKYTFKMVDKATVPASGFVFDPATQIAAAVKQWQTEYSR